MSGFEKYVKVVKNVLSEEFGEEFIEELSTNYAIRELKTAEFIINDDITYEDAIYVSIEEDHNNDIILTVGKAISSAGIYEFSNVQSRIYNIMKRAKDIKEKLRLYNSQRNGIDAIIRISVLDYGIFYTDDVGNRWSMFMPMTELELHFRTRPLDYELVEVLRWALSELTQSMVFGILATRGIDYIDDLMRVVEDSWDKYHELTEE